MMIDTTELYILKEVSLVLTAIQDHKGVRKQKLLRQFYCKELDWIWYTVETA